jgi:hypothetical protein
MMATIILYYIIKKNLKIAITQLGSIAQDSRAEKQVVGPNNNIIG